EGSQQCCVGHIRYPNRFMENTDGGGVHGGRCQKRSEHKQSRSYPISPFLVSHGPPSPPPFPVSRVLAIQIIEPSCVGISAYASANAPERERYCKTVMPLLRYRNSLKGCSKILFLSHALELKIRKRREGCSKARARRWSRVARAPTGERKV